MSNQNIKSQLMRDILAGRKGTFGIQRDQQEDAVFLFTEGCRLKVVDLHFHLESSTGLHYDRDLQSFQDIAAIRTSKVLPESSRLTAPELVIYSGAGIEGADQAEILSTEDTFLSCWLLINALQEYQNRPVLTALAAIFNGCDESTCIAVADTNTLLVRFMRLALVDKGERNDVT